MAGLERLADRELGGMEALFVKGDSEIASRSTVTALFVFDRQLDFDDVLVAHDRGTRKAVRFRQRVVAPVVPISRPYWIVDPDFDLRYHVRRAHLVDGGSPRDLLAASERIGQVPLDPARPLWEVTLITGLDDGTSALLYKMHHAITDGGGGPALFAKIFTSEPAPLDRALPAAPAVEDVTATELTRQRVGQLPYQLVGSAVGAVSDLAGLGKRVVRSPRSSVGGVLDYARSFRRTMASGPTPSPLLARRGLRRYYGTVSGSTNQLRDAAKRMECSLNDVYIAALCGAVGRYHERMGLPVESIPLAMPVSVRRPDDPIDSNRFVGARIEAPLAVADVSERAKLIHERVVAVRSEPALGAISVFAPVASLLPMWVLTSVLTLQPSDVQASNIPSWTESQYLGSAKLISTYSFGPLAMSALMSVLATYDDDFDIGLNIDPDAFSDPSALVEMIAAEFEALVSPGQIELRA
jgi:diacylglycerol O-acyltransferase